MMMYQQICQASKELPKEGKGHNVAWIEHIIKIFMRLAFGTVIEQEKGQCKHCHPLKFVCQEVWRFKPQDVVPKRPENTAIDKICQ